MINSEKKKNEKKKSEQIILVFLSILLQKYSQTEKKL